MSFSLPDIFFYIVLFQLLFLAFFLFTNQQGKRVSNILLGLFFLSICLNLMDVFLLVKQVYFSATAWALWGSCLPLLFGPLLFLCTQSFLVKDFSLKGKKWLHFLPFLVFFLVTEISYLSLSSASQLDLLGNILRRTVSPSLYIGSAIIFLQFLVYVAASLRLIQQYKKLAADKYSNRQRTNVSWLYSTIMFFTVLMLMSISNSIISLTPFAKYYYVAVTIILFGMLLFMTRILLDALRRPELFSLIEEGDSAKQGSSIPIIAATVQADEGKLKMLQQAKEYMTSQKPWLDPELTLDQLAVMLAIKPKALSQVINEQLQQNFFDFVNRYRIEEAKRLLTNPADKKITVLEVLYEVGFNSKSSFNTLFKKYTGLTPSEFKKKHLLG